MYILSAIFLGVILDFPKVDLSSCKCINPYFVLFLKMEELKLSDGNGMSIKYFYFT